MTINETPVDCFRVKYFISGSEQEIIEEEKKYIAKFPYMSYGTIRKETTEGGVVMLRFRTPQICAKACTHTPNTSPVGAETEKGKDHTVFQTTS